MAPGIMTFHDLAERIVRLLDPAARPLTRVQRRLLLEAILGDMHKADELPHFARILETRGFGEGVVQLLEEFKRQGVAPHHLARAAVRRAEEAPGERSAVLAPRDQQCLRLYTRYQQMLQRLQRYDLDGRLWHARDLLHHGLPEELSKLRVICVDDFTTFTPPQLDLLVLLAQSGAELWIALLDEEGTERPELFASTQATRQRLLSRLRPRMEYLRVAPSAPVTQEGGFNFSERPAGLLHLEQQLFRPVRAVTPSSDAAGLRCIEAPGLVGEARLVARQIKQLLLERVPAGDILVSMRDLAPYASLLQEVFAEYGLPVDIEGTDPLLHHPLVASLLRAVRLPEEDFPFAGVTALLRSTLFRPAWPEAQREGVFHAEIPQRAEALLRLLGEPRGREAYLVAVRRWAEEQQPGLEDEQAEESRRRRTHLLAQECCPFLERFFQAWAGMPSLAPLEEHLAWLRRFSTDLGLMTSAQTDAGSPFARGWERFWQEIDSWLALERERHNPPPLLDHRTFVRRLTALAAEAGLARTPRDPGRICILSAPLARYLDSEYLFLMGLGERSFPRLVLPAALLEEQERQNLRQAGLPLTTLGDLLPEETLLFYQLVTRPRRELILSYPALDDRGQPLLPSSFLHAILDCFTPGAIPVERRSMLIEGYDREQPLSPAELRVRAATRVSQDLDSASVSLAKAGLPVELAANLSAAADLVRQRFGAADYTPFDGLVRASNLIEELQHLVGPQKVFSPTALEEYVACPFRFFLSQVLRLEPLEDPREEIEMTRRGQAFHRALSRLHQQLRARAIHRPEEAIDSEVLGQLQQAIREDIDRAPSPASKALWQLEGERMLRRASQYRRQWQTFVKPWVPLAVEPRPHLFEVDFGLGAAAPTRPLVIRGEGMEVRISGRIDRVDIAPLAEGVGFWIIDYKTGRGEHYTSSALVEFQRLQLTLYALAVEEVLLQEHGARPLGLAYWLVTDEGPKVVLPTEKNKTLWLNETKRWRQVREVLEKWVLTLVSHIRQGSYPLKPRSEHCTQTCDFSQICRISQARSVEKSWQLPLPLLAKPSEEPARD